jgi:replicative DNA helicase
MIQDRPAVANEEAELQVLSAMLYDRESLRYGAETLDPDDFTERPRRILFRALADLAAKDTAPELTLVMRHLEAGHALEAVGGKSGLIDLMGQAPVYSQVPQYAKILKDRSLMRRVERVAAEVQALVRQGRQEDASGLLEAVQAKWAALETADLRESMRPLRELLVEAWEDLEIRQDDKHRQLYLTPWERYDNLLGGLEEGRLYVWAGRPKCGKTTAVVNLLTHLSLRQGVPVAMFSMEMKAAAVAQKIISAETGVSSFGIRMGRLRDEDIQNVIAAIPGLQTAPFLVDDKRGLSPIQLVTRARRVVRQHGVKVVAIDYLQLVKHGNSRDNRVGFMQAVHDLQELAGESNVALVLLSQLSRSVNTRAGKFPTLEDLKETGALEEDADAVTFLYHPPDGDPSPQGGVMQFVVAANRYGATGSVPVYWDPDHQRIRDVTPSEEIEEGEQPKPRGRRLFWQGN